MMSQIFSSLCFCHKPQILNKNTINIDNENNINNCPEEQNKHNRTKSYSNYINKNQQSIQLNNKKERISVNNSKLMSRRLSIDYKFLNKVIMSKKKYEDENDENKIINDFKERIDDIINESINKKSISESDDLSYDCNYDNDNVNKSLLSFKD